MMKLISKGRFYLLLSGLLVATTIFFTSCLPPIIRKAPHDKLYIVTNKIEVKGGNFSRNEKTDLEQRLYNQIDDSAKIEIKDILFFLHVIKNPPVFDTAASNRTAKNINSSLFHLGYYDVNTYFKTDTTGKKVNISYIVEAGNPTRIGKIKYRLQSPELQSIASAYASQSKLKINQPITRTGVLQEISRLVDSFRNNGYYKFTAAELKVRGDTTFGILTRISSDPMEQIRLLGEAEKQKDSPSISLSIVLNPPSDSSRLSKYKLKDIYIFPDFKEQDKFTDSGLHTVQIKNLKILYHTPMYHPSFLARNISLKPGSIFRQDEYNRTFSNLAKTGVWQNINMAVREDPDSAGLLNMFIELAPMPKLGFEAALEASYLSANNATSALSGNLFGLSMNLSLTNRNLGKEAIRMRHTFRTGIELNNNRAASTNLLSSKEIGYSNNIIFPKIIFPKLVSWLATSGESFINTNIGFNSRLDLFNMQSIILNFGWNAPYKKNNAWKLYFRPLNMEFSNLFNETDSFKKIKEENPFLRYSYNTAYITGMSLGASNYYSYPRHLFSRSRERSFRFNLEESGLTWGNLPLFKKYLRRYIKFDAEYKYTITYPKTILAFRSFVGVGVTLLGSDTNRTMPFFKQFFGGGVNSMRGWPARGIGIGGQARVPFSSSQTTFNDRTGDIQLEANMEYRYDILRIIPNTLILRGALFIDVGNVWNLRNLKYGVSDSSSFDLQNLYKQLGVSVGTGFRIDFNYVVLRLDLGFRFKRPDLFYENAGWKLPNIGFDDFVKKIFTKGTNDEYRQWRYDNFNFSIGISYPF